MKIYDDHFYCFSCQCGGDVIRLVSQLFSLSPLEAAKKLQADFGIADVRFDKESYKKECNTRMKQLLKEKQFESWKHNTYLYPFLSLRSGTKRYENVFLSLFFLYNSSYRDLGILQITGR